jgi:hypothetical protein
MAADSLARWPALLSCVAALGCADTASNIGKAEAGDGAIGDGATGDGDAGAPFAVPQCLRDLFAACPLEGQCVQTDLAAPQVRSCFDNGTEQLFVRGTPCGIDTRVYRGDGSLCYSASVGPANSACEGVVITWKDAEGAVVATAFYYPNGSSFAPSATITCAVGGEKSDCYSTMIGGCDWSGWPHLPECAPGVCGTDATSAP